MKSKNIFIASLLITASANSFGQFAYCSTADIERQKQSTTVVAVSNDDAFNKTAEEVMASVWKAGKYKVIKTSELAAYLKITPVNYVMSYIELEKSITTNTSHYGTDMITSKTKTSYSKMLVIIPNRKTEEIKKREFESSMFRCFIDPYLDFVDEKAEFTREVSIINNIYMLPGLADSQLGYMKMMMHYPTADAKKITTKELWMAENDVKPDDDKMKGAYPFPYKIVTKKEIAAAINAKRKDIVYLAHIVADDQKQEIYAIQTAENNEILMLLSCSGVPFDNRHLSAVRNAASKTK